MAGNNRKARNNRPRRSEDVPMDDISQARHRDSQQSESSARHPKIEWGPRKNRSCTDILCLLLFIAFLGGWIFMLDIFYRRIDIERTYFPTDSHDDICGRGKYKDKPYLAYFNIFQCVASPEVSIIEGCKTPQVCVSKCSEKTFSINENDDVRLRSLQAELAICQNGILPTSQNILKLVTDGKCARYYFSSTSLGGRCIPSVINIINQTFVKDDLSGTEMGFKNGSSISTNSLVHNSQILGNLIGALSLAIQSVDDCVQVWRYLAVGLLFVVVIAIVWMFLMQYTAHVMAWITILSLLALNAGGFYYSLRQYQSYQTAPNATIEKLVEARSAKLTEYRMARMMDSDSGVYFRSAEAPLPMVPVFKSQTSFRYVNLADDLNFQLDLGKMIKEQLNTFMEKESTWKYLTYILGGLLAFLLLLLCCLCSRIRLACAIIEESGTALLDMKSTLAFPILTYSFWLLSVIIGIVAFVVISSGTQQHHRFENGTICSPVDLNDSSYIDWDGTKMSTQTPKVSTSWFSSSAPTSSPSNETCILEKSPFERKYVYGAHGINLFAILWIMFFLQDVCFVTLSGTFSTWYWTFKKTDVPFFTLPSSFCTTLRYHLGSIAFGSLIMTIVRFLRIVLEYIDSKLKKYSDFDLTRYVMMAFKCCLWLLEKFVKFINKNAYIYMAMYGSNFCTSARKAFEIVVKNPIRAMVLSWLSDFLLFLSRLAVTGIVSTAMYFLLTNHFPFIATFELTQTWPPLTLFTILAYLLAGQLFNVYQVAIDTIFFCYLKDSELNDGSAQKPYFMSKKLGRVFRKHNEPSQTE